MPIGGDFAVERNFAEQGFAVDPSGNLLIVWTEQTHRYAQRFTNHGSLLGDKLDLGDFTASQFISHPSIAINSTGDFVLAWEGWDEEHPSPYDVNARHELFARRYNSAGIPQTDVITVATTSDRQHDPLVSIDATGAFVVAWTKTGLGGRLPNVFDDDFHSDTFGRRFSASGAPVGGVFQIDTTNVGNQYLSSLSMAPSGAFVVAFTSQTTSMDSDVLVRLYDSQGNPQGNDLLVNVSTDGFQEQPSVGIANDGRFVVAWNSQIPLSSDDAKVIGRLFSSTGMPHSNEFEISDPCRGSTIWPSVVIAADGRFAVSWTAEVNQQRQQDVFIRSYGVNGLPDSQPIVASTTSDAWQYQSHIAGNATGEIAATWTNHQIGGTRETLTRRFSLGRPQPQNVSTAGASASSVRLRVLLNAPAVEFVFLDNNIPITPLSSGLVAQGQLAPAVTGHVFDGNEQAERGKALSKASDSSLVAAQLLATASIFSEYAREHIEDDSTIGMIASDPAGFELIR